MTKKLFYYPSLFLILFYFFPFLFLVIFWWFHINILILVASLPNSSTSYITKKIESEGWTISTMEGAKLTPVSVSITLLLLLVYLPGALFTLVWNSRYNLKHFNSCPSLHNFLSQSCTIPTQANTLRLLFTL